MHLIKGNSSRYCTTPGTIVIDSTQIVEMPCIDTEKDEGHLERCFSHERTAEKIGKGRQRTIIVQVDVRVKKSTQKKK